MKGVSLTTACGDRTQDDGVLISMTPDRVTFRVHHRREEFSLTLEAVEALAAEMRSARWHARNDLPPTVAVPADQTIRYDKV